MRKILTILSLAIITISCSSNENEMNETSIIGKWNQTDIIIKGESRKNECTTKNSITFNENKSLSWLNHNGEDCELDGDGAYTGTWNEINSESFEFRTDEGFVLTKMNNQIEIQEDNDESRTWIFKKQ
ncbi:hypothetical protein [Tenacibaculum soleae]|uniref:hypothetical protein n=1 Tax=Tenacibaculum soleae TaxID=447689 RepID=UPI0022FFCF7D|nr:hypothetical protein [Tenacibaculum soleae]